MVNVAMIGLVAALATLCQSPDEVPPACKQKIEAAAKAEKAGDYPAAEALLLEVVKEAEKLGESDIRLATELELLAGFYLDRKRERFAEAERLVSRALVIREKSQGVSHTDVASTLILLASCRLGSKGKQAENVGPTLRRAMTILERSKAKDDPQFARALELMGFWQLLHGEFVEAEAKFTEALVIREKLPERDDRAIANVLDDLGALHTAQVDRIDIEAIRAEVAGKPKPESSVEQHGHLAEVYYTRALAIREKVLKPDDRNITESLFNLGQLAMIRGRPADGERYLERWLTLEEKTGIRASEKQGNVRLILASASIERKDYAEAERRLAKTQAVFEQVNGAESDDVTRLLLSRAEVATMATQFDSAERFIKQSLKIQAVLIGPESEDVVEASTMMAGHYQDHAQDPAAQSCGIA